MAAAQYALSQRCELTTGIRPYCVHIIYTSPVIKKQAPCLIGIKISTVYRTSCRMSDVVWGGGWIRHQSHMVHSESVTDMVRVWRRRWLGNGLHVSSHAATTFLVLFGGWAISRAAVSSEGRADDCFWEISRTGSLGGGGVWGGLRNIYKAVPSSSHIKRSHLTAVFSGPWEAVCLMRADACVHFKAAL